MTLLAAIPMQPPEAIPAGEGALAALSPYMGVFFIAFFAAIVLTPLVRRLAINNGIIDYPDLKRKNHLLPVAYLGGVAIFLAWLAAVLLSNVVTPDTGDYMARTHRLPSFPLALILGAGVITVTGVIDDVYGIPARVKVGGQLFAAAALTSQHVGINATDALFGLVGIDLPSQFSYFIATFIVAIFVLGGCNAVNLIDGLDGLASGLVAIAMMGFLAIALLAGQGGDALAALEGPTLIVLCLATLGAIFGFLPYNFNPASIFMGDAGSLLLGFLSVTAILLLGDTGANALRLTTAALIVFAVPITDTSLAIIRRKLRGQPLFSPDNQHLHHLLRRTGMTVRQSVVSLYALAVMFALIGIALVALELRWRYVLAVFFVLYGFIMVTAFKYGAQCIARDRLRQEQAARDEAIAPDAPIDQPAPPVGNSGDGDVNGDSAAGFGDLTEASSRSS